MFPIHDAGDDGEPFPEVLIFFLVILSIADLLTLARLSEDMPQGIDEAGMSAEDPAILTAQMQMPFSMARAAERTHHWKICFFGQEAGARTRVVPAFAIFLHIFGK